MLEEEQQHIFYRQAVGPLFDVYDSAKENGFPPSLKFYSSSVCLKETQRYKCMVDLKFLMAFLSFSLCASHGLC